jgi:long-subunit fatty acid transport protein
MVEEIHLPPFLKHSLASCLLICAGAISSQPDTINESIVNHQIWIDIYPHYYISEKLEYYGDAGYRTIISSNKWRRIYVRPAVRYHLNDRWQLQGGLGFFFDFRDIVSNRFEIRPWQGIQLNWPTIRNLKFKNLLRLEQRNSFETEDWSYSFDLRLRFKVSGRYDFCRECSDQFWFTTFYVEGFFPINDDVEELFRNRARVGIGCGYNVSKEWRVSFVFNWQRSRSGPEDQFSVNDFVYQLKVRKLWNGEMRDWIFGIR